MSGSVGGELAEMLRKIAGDLEDAYVAPRVCGADETTMDLYSGCTHRPCRTCSATCYVPPDTAELVDAGRVEVVCYQCNGMFDDYGPQVSFRGIGC